MFVTSFAFIIPELVLGFGSLGLLMWGVFHQRDNTRQVTHLACLTLLVAVGVLIGMDTNSKLLFGGQLINDTFGNYAKVATLVAAVFVLLSTRESIFRDEVARFEYPVLILLSILGMMIMISAKGFLSLFLGLELQSLSLYILTAIRRDDSRASEAGMKYYILGALSTGILLYGISLIYGLTGSVTFDAVHTVLLQNSTVPIQLYVAFAFILSGVIFKVSAVPFHMWTPDVYEGAPTSVTAFLSSVPKIAAFAMIIRLMADPFLAGLVAWKSLLVLICILSMVIGSVTALTQRSVKRLIAYSSISNAGYALIGLLTGTPDGIQATIIYVLLYGFTVIGFFACLVTIVRRGVQLDTIQDFAGVSKIYPRTVFVMGFMLFSMAGVPPLAGFLGKFYIFNAALEANLITLAVIGVLTSVISAAYYLWLVKVMTMDPLDEAAWSGSEVHSRDSVVTLMKILITALLIWFFIKPSFFLQFTSEAASSLFTK